MGLRDQFREDSTHGHGEAERDWNGEGNIISHKTQYKYLGLTITQNGRDEGYIRRRIEQGKVIIRQLHPHLWNKNIKAKYNKQIYQTIFESCVTYGVEIWLINKDSQLKNTTYTKRGS